jgi:O-antigen ligase
VLAPLVLWSLWSTASLLWSRSPDYTLRELRAEVVWNVLTMVIFYVSAYGHREWRALALTALATLAAMAGLAVSLALFGESWSTGSWHAGVGAYATYLVLAAPMMIVLLAPASVDIREGAPALAIGLTLCALLLAAARLTDNRMVWVALAALSATAAGLGALRWRAGFARARWRWLALAALLLLVLGALFTDAAREKARAHFPPDTTVAQTLEQDPRLALWNQTAALIAERPWTGYGFGKAIVRQELRGSLGDPMLSHAHNVFISQWLQTGAVGLGLFVALLAAIAWRYVRFYRAPGDTLAVLGIVGLALLVGFVVKNLTDDFLVRSNARLFWALNAALLGWGIRLERAQG